MKQKDHEVGAQQWMEGQKEPDGVFSSELKYSTVSVESNEWLVVRANWSPSPTEMGTKGSYSWFRLWYFMTFFQRETLGQPGTQHLDRSKHISMLTHWCFRKTEGKEEKGRLRPDLHQEEKCKSLHETEQDHQGLKLLCLSKAIPYQIQDRTSSVVVNIRIWLFSVRP